MLLEPNQKSNRLSVNRKCGQRFAIDDRRALTKLLGADKGASSLPTLGNKNYDAMFDCKVSGFRQSEDKHNLYIYIVIVIFHSYHLLCFCL